MAELAARENTGRVRERKNFRRRFEREERKSWRVTSNETKGSNLCWWFTNNKLSSRYEYSAHYTQMKKTFYAMIFPLNYVKNICQSRFLVETANIVALAVQPSTRLDQVYLQCFK